MSDNARDMAMQGLLREGAVKYLDAFCALWQFKILVTDVSAKSLQSNLPDLERATGIVGLSTKTVGRYWRPKDSDREYSGSWAWIGAEVQFPGNMGCECYLGLEYWRLPSGDYVPNVSVSYKVHSRPTTYRWLKSVFLPHEPEYWENPPDQECGFYRKLESPPSIESLRKQFDDIMQFSVVVWNNAGGWQSPTIT